VLGEGAQCGLHREERPVRHDAGGAAVPELPEALVADRQAVYFRYFLDVETIDNSVISDDDVAYYARACGDRPACAPPRDVPGHPGQERPDEVAELIERHASTSDAPMG